MESSSYWYKFNLASAVKKWVDGTKTNYGVSFISEEETDKEYNWRAFATKNYSTSSYRPYTVITYTNDTTAPTVTSVTGNPTSWTSSSVTLTVNGAADNSGGAGLSSTPYSFSTTKGSYSWQSSKSKTFSSNCTVYVYVRDAYNNIRLVSTQTISKIDKTAPTYTSITGNPTSWTNNSVTLTVNGASDSASGLSSSPYSFSTASGVYNWNSSNSKTFSENQTVYIYARDAVGNIKLLDTVVIDKIDKTAPTAPIISGNDTEWSNGNIILTAESTDDESGVSQYSFSTSEDEYNWNSANSAVFDDSSTVYVYSKDNAGNISDVSTTIIKVDTQAPAGGVVVGNSSQWVQSVTLTVNDASDELSGLNAEAYSFSTSEEEYNWQESNSKSITANGTIYVYVRDAAGNIKLVDTVVIDKIDRTAPTINSIDVQDKNGETTVTVEAADTASGIALYSFDNGETWQESNEYTFETDTYNYLFIKVKDNAGNISSKRYDFYTPQIYQENGRIVLYNPNPKCESEIYYKTSLPLTSKWTEYSEPITASGKIYVSFIKPANSLIASNYVTITIPEETYDAGKYEESNLDAEFTYKNVSFNFSRAYDNENNKWFFSINSCLQYDNEKKIYKATLPDGSKINLLPKSENLYYNVFNNYTLYIIRNNDNSVKSYTLIIGEIYYNYNADGILVSISNRFDDKITFDWSYDEVIVSDGADREYVVELDSDSNILSITDPAGGIIAYTYNNTNHLIKVVDQAGIVISKYEYTDDLIAKSMDSSITYDSSGRVVKLLKDNGYSTEFEYSENSIYITQSNEQSTSVTYDNSGKILSATDEYGDVTTYTYDDVYGRLTKVSKNDTVESEYTYNGVLPYNTDNYMLYSKSDSNSTVYYYYDENNNVIKTEEYFEDSSSEDTYTYYVYDDFGNLILCAKYLTNNYGSEPTVYDPEAEYDSVVEYEYSSGLLTKTNDIDNNTVSIYTYDSYANIIKTTTTKTEDEQTVVSVSENTYDILGRIISEKSDDSQITYTYDAAGRTLLTNADGENSRTVYDSSGRVVQTISGDDYNPELDNIPYDYSDKTVGYRYEYDETGNLVKETNENGLTTEYEYSTVGTLYKKSFDIYDYYYKNSGNCDRIDVNGKTIVDYEYKVNDSSVSLSSDEYINRISYSNGYVEEQKTDKYGNVSAKYSNGSTEEYYKFTSGSVGYTDHNIELGYRVSTTFDEDVTEINWYEGEGLPGKAISNYTVTFSQNECTIDEWYFSNYFTTITTESSVSYSSGVNYTLETDDDNNSISEVYQNGEDVVFSVNSSYDEDNKKFTKFYNDDFSFYNSYNDNGLVISDESNSYYYDENEELVSTNGIVNSSYVYDSRGNMLSKTSDGNVTTFAYNNELWQDQLTSVNGQELEYDSNGNLISYDGKEYSWSYGKKLASVIDSENTYSYTYDGDGIRASKTINGVTTEYRTINGNIIAQSDGTDVLYFQYNDNTPVGFIKNKVQYLYITNVYGDVVGITDNQGNLLATYAYDEWGKLLSIETAEEDNEEQLELATLNPLRYRGYYYDSETGLYYLQSRYYDPELCRFISADDFDYIDNYHVLNINAYAYCINDPINNIDYDGYKSVNKSEKNKIIDKYEKYMKNKGYTSKYSLNKAQNTNYEVTKDKYGLYTLTCEYRMSSNNGITTYYNSVYLYGTSSAWKDNYSELNKASNNAEAFAQGFMSIENNLILIIFIIELLIIFFGAMQSFDEDAEFYNTCYKKAKNNGGDYGILQTFSKTTYNIKKGTTSTTYIVSN